MVVSNDWYDCFQSEDSKLFSMVIKDLNITDLEYFQGLATDYFTIVNDRRKKEIENDDGDDNNEENFEWEYDEDGGIESS